MNIDFTKNFFLSLVLILLSTVTLLSQNTVGTTFQDSTLQDGYTLFFPDFQPNVYLIDPCGQIVNTWEGNEDFAPGFSVYLSEEGNLIKAKRPNLDPEGAILSASGQAGYVEILDWDNNQIFEYSLILGNRRLHHDIEPLPNGNILVNAWERLSLEDLLALGRDPETIINDEIFDEVIMEINPNTSEVVWEWKAFDHLIQTFNTSAPNWVGNPSAWSQRIDLNYVGDSNRRKDWLHFNGIDYNEELDQIMVSSPTFGEFWIIDHSTSTEEAAGTNGGRSGRGGDLLYRWGNPEAYSAGDVSDKKLFFQHAPQWVSEQLSDKSQRKGEVILFNNRLANYSAVEILTLPTFDSLTWNYVKDNVTFGPDQIDRRITHPLDSTLLFSSIMSSGQVLDNGNVFICATIPGNFIEVTPDNEIAWEYKIPLNQGARLEQGGQTSLGGSLTFKAEKYPLTFAGFDGRDLSPQGFLELNPDTTICSFLEEMMMDTMMVDTMMMDTMMMDTMMMDTMMVDTMMVDTMMVDTMMIDSMGVSTIDLQLLSTISLYPNPTSNQINLEWPLRQDRYTIFSIDGKKQVEGKLREGLNSIDVHHLPPGFYLINMGEIGAKKFIKRE